MQCPVAWTNAPTSALVVLGYAVAVGISALLVIHLSFTPVPITGQAFAVLVGGMTIGWARGALGIATYAALGLIGVPWFDRRGRQ